MKSVWVTWEDHRRSRELANVLDAEYILLLYKASRWLRYPLLSLRTVSVLIRLRPSHVFCQNPSIILATLLAVLRPLFGYKLIVDRHSNFKFYSRESTEWVWRIFHKLSDYTLRKADLTIVTNDYLKEFLEKLGGRGFVLQDKLPQMSVGSNKTLGGKFNAVFVSTFAKDEPIKEIFSASKCLPEDTFIYVTGSYKNYPDIQKLICDKPENLILTGFLPEDEYQTLLRSADAIIVITDQEYTLTCGAYEAVTLEKAMVLADTATIKEYFSQGAVYATKDVDSLINAINDVRLHQSYLSKETKQLKEILLINWSDRFLNLKKLISYL